MDHPRYRPDIDGLRAVAVLVDVFLVISGFLISTIIFGNLAKGTFSFAESTTTIPLGNHALTSARI